VRAPAGRPENDRVDPGRLKQRRIHPGCVADVPRRGSADAGRNAIDTLHDGGIWACFERFARIVAAYGSVKIAIVAGEAVYDCLDLRDCPSFSFAGYGTALDLHLR